MFPATFHAYQRRSTADKTKFFSRIGSVFQYSDRVLDNKFTSNFIVFFKNRTLYGNVGSRLNIRCETHADLHLLEGVLNTVNIQGFHYMTLRKPGVRANV
jgi:hypothetical protein